MHIRDEAPGDEPAIHAVVEQAFRSAPHSSGTEAHIVDALRAADALTVSLVAVEDGAVCGHVAFSPVTVDGAAVGWHGLGPLAVHPRRQRQGMGSQLVLEGLARLRTVGSQGCVVLGDPLYYGRFGFRARAELTLAGVPAAYFQALPFTTPMPEGSVDYHAAFAAGV
ncbi:GNAT family N-acetyltransferase [Chelatococcus asaccharovorans]|uniref:GNAT family N-acetyltransferase n=1 Tax=Chelatococcus asaccharovorans TaxID=28210 RepID=UPI00224C6FB7|nr:N-acetyltransferase [Chelatococcus asaccharovorans]CAH1659997.1 putative acetyltransferase [Chelatococcus asaccharovorans]CAH1683975.1 putative acetyltransferase [Chelatococcus asaccharovorans]